jgi:hypothetical protein
MPRNDDRDAQDPHDQQGSDDATARQKEAGSRRGEIIPGKGFDPGGGYGGAGNKSLYDAKSSYGGQSGMGGNTMRGAYAGEPYGRVGDEDVPADRTDAGDTRPSGGGFSAREGEFDPDSPLGGERRDPSR